MTKKPAGKPKKSASIRVRMDEGLKMRLEQLAVLQSLDVSDIARMAFAHYISKHQQPMMSV